MKSKFQVMLVIVACQLTSLAAFADPNGAQQQGLLDGQPPGTHEAQDRGPVEGAKQGQDDGYKDGFNSCQQQAEKDAYDRGFAQGDQAGQTQGKIDGQAQGQKDGQAAGISAGTTDGQSRADSDASVAATAAGNLQGITDAAQSDAAALGAKDGAAQGDQEAQQQAAKYDYQKGVQAYSDSAYASTVASQDTFSQRPQALPAPTIRPAIRMTNRMSQLGDLSGMQVASTDPSQVQPDFRFYNPIKTYPTQAETQAYQTGYRQGYVTGFQQAYPQLFTAAYGPAHQQGENQGCDAAHHGDYSAQFNQGVTDGQKKGYSDAFTTARNAAYKTAYDAAFRSASEQSYQAVYQTDYVNHYNTARAASATQQKLVNYQTAFNSAEQQRYAQVYPTYAAQQFQKGQIDGAAAFSALPVRLISAEIQTLPSGLYEPGEPLRLTFVLRNFSASAVSGQNVKITVQALDADGTVVPMPSSTLVNNLNPNSQTTVTDALEIRLTESAVNQYKRFQVSVYYMDHDGGDQTVQADAEFLLEAEIDSQPALGDGTPGMVQFRVTNRSQVTPSVANSTVSLSSVPGVLDVDQPSQTIGALAPGQSIDVSFAATAHGYDVLSIPFAVSIKAPDGRVVGLFDQNDSVYLQNQYEISVDDGVYSLRRPGVVDVQYTIKNDGSALLYKGLQLKVSVLGANASTIQILGPNPQYLTPVAQGQSISFSVPILSSVENAGGTLLFEIDEDGKSVDVHQVSF